LRPWPPWPPLRLLGLSVGVAMVLSASAMAEVQGDPWQALRQPGHAVFMRHSEAPGGAGDPSGFRPDDCATQRNLSENGRAHARRTALALQRNNVAFDQVFTSPWCRCRDTALLVTGKQGEDLAALSNLVGREEYRTSQIAALKARLAELDPNSRVLFVTHGILIAALIGVHPAQGEMVVVRIGIAGETSVAGRLLVD
jgi:broad specificity phosphatase PhoE